MKRNVAFLVSIIAGVFLGTLSNWLYDLLKAGGFFPDQPTLKSIMIIGAIVLPFLVLVALPQLLDWGHQKEPEGTSDRQELEEKLPSCRHNRVQPDGGIQEGDIKFTFPTGSGIQDRLYKPSAGPAASLSIIEGFEALRFRLKRSSTSSFFRFNDVVFVGTGDLLYSDSSDEFVFGRKRIVRLDSSEFIGYDSGIIDLGPCSFEDIAAPEDASYSSRVPAIAGHVYAVRSPLRSLGWPQRTYGIFKVTRLDLTQEPQVVIKLRYRPDGGREFRRKKFKAPEEFLRRYAEGERTFKGEDLRAIDLRGQKLPEIDLEGTNLSRADIREAHLVRANLKKTILREAYLEGAELIEARLDEATLIEADLFKANLTGAELNRANLTEAYLEEVTLTGASLEDVDLNGADLFKANLNKAKLRGASIIGTCLEGAYLNGAILEGANLGDADLRGANLRGADLTGATMDGVKIDDDTQIDDKWHTVWQIVNQDIAGLNLSGADLSGANLKGVDLTGANLSDANLIGADLRGAKLTGADLVRVKADDSTQLDDKWRLVWEIVNQGAAGRDLSGVDLSGANLSGAILSSADLSEANLSGANLSGADIRRAKLNRTNMYKANLDDTKFSRADLRGAVMPDGTIHD